MKIWMALCALLALASGQYHPGLSGTEVIDFGRVTPGHFYNYRHWFVNRSGRPLRLYTTSMRCQSCPQVIRHRSWLAPGDSVELYFYHYFGREFKDSTSFHVYVYTNDDRAQGMWIYTLKAKVRSPFVVKVVEPKIDVRLNDSGFFAGSIRLISQTKDTLLAFARGLPSGFRFDRSFPVKLAPRQAQTINFQVSPEVIGDHRSLTLSFENHSGRELQRLSLPFAYEK